MGYLIAAALFLYAVWVFFDAYKLRKHTLREAAGWALGTLAVWLFVVPLYFAQRHLRAGETREGGDGWNYLKTFAVLWTIVMLAVGAHYILAASEVASTAHTGAAQAGAAIGVTLGFGVVWFFPVVGALLLGLVLKKTSIVEKGPTGPLALQVTGAMTPGLTACPTCGNAPLKGMPCPTCGRSASPERKRKGTMAVVGIMAAALVVGLVAVRLLKGREVPKAIPAIAPSEGATVSPRAPAVHTAAAADQPATHSLSFAAFRGELLNECDDLEITGSVQLTDAGPLDLEQAFAAISDSPRAKAKENLLTRLRRQCGEEFRDRTPLATCMWAKDYATGTLRGRIAHYSAKDVFSSDSLMKECLSVWHGKWNAVSRDSEEYRRAASQEATPGSPAIVSDGQGTLQFGKPTVKDTGFGMTRVMVQVRNVTDRQISCMVTATFTKRDTILGTANGNVNNLRAGSLKTAELMSTDQVRGYDTVRLETGGCF
jgi:hypothetical protein